MLKLLVLLLLCIYLDLSIWNLWLFHIVPQQSHTNLSVCSVHFFNRLLSQLDLFNHVFGYCWYQHWRQIFLSAKLISFNKQLILQSNELFKMCLFYSKVLYQSDICVVIFLENIGFYIQVTGIIFGHKNVSKFVLVFAKVHIVGKS